MAFFTRAWHKLRATWAPLPQIDAALWLRTLRPYPFLNALPLHEQARLRALAAVFLQRKEFTGAHGLTVTDDMALAIAAQACLPLLHWGSPHDALSWYDDFVGIVIHPGHALARRTAMDGAGVSCSPADRVGWGCRLKIRTTQGLCGVGPDDHPVRGWADWDLGGG